HFPAPPTTPTSPLSLHDALPIYGGPGDPPLGRRPECDRRDLPRPGPGTGGLRLVASEDERIPNHFGADRMVPAAHACRVTSTWADRKSTRLNSSHDQISYAVFCL